MSATICPSCLSRSFDAGRCGKCGFVSGEYTAARTALPLGSLVGSYRIGVMKSNSRQSQIYTAVHNETSVPVIIEEFFPAKVAGRAQNAEEVTLASADPEVMKRFQQGCLLIEASAQKRPLKRIDTVRANNTVYSIFEPVTTVNAATQCEMMADNPYYFRDQNGMPQMTINTLPIPPMPAERKYTAEQYLNRRPITQPSEETDHFSGSVITEGAEAENKRKKGLIIGIIAAAVVLLALGVLIVTHFLGGRGGGTEQTTEPTITVTEPVDETVGPDESAAPQTETVDVTTTPEKAEDGQEKQNDDSQISGTGGRGQMQDNGVIVNEPGVEGETEKKAVGPDGHPIEDTNKESGNQAGDNNEDSKAAEDWKVKEEADESTGSTNGNETTVTEAPAAETDTGTVNNTEDFLKQLVLISRSGKEMISGRKYTGNGFTVNPRDIRLPVGLKMHTYTEKGKKEQTTSLFWTNQGKKEEENQLFALVGSGDDWYKVQVGLRTRLNETSCEYSDDKDLMICLKLWENVGNTPEGALMTFVPENGGAILELLDNDLTTALKQDGQTFTLEENGGETILIISKGSTKTTLKLEPLDKEETEVKEVPDDGNSEMSQAPAATEDTGAESSEKATEGPTNVPTENPTEAPTNTPEQTTAPTQPPKEGSAVSADGLIVRDDNNKDEGNGGTTSVPAGTNQPAAADNSSERIDLNKCREISKLEQTDTLLTVWIRVDESVITNVEVRDSRGNSLQRNGAPSISVRKGWKKWEFSKTQSGKIESVTITYYLNNGRRQTETRQMQQDS